MRVEIVPYESWFAGDFERLTRGWIEKCFGPLEPADEAMVRDPEATILSKGGFIVFARIGEEIVGTSALLRIDAQTYELAKMTVEEERRGLGIGRKLIERCVEIARAHNARSVTLETNSKLAPAINLYRRAGFREVETLGHASDYTRTDYFMVLEL